MKFLANKSKAYKINTAAVIILVGIVGQTMYLDHSTASEPIAASAKRDGRSIASVGKGKIAKVLITPAADEIKKISQAAGLSHGSRIYFQKLLKENSNVQAVYDFYKSKLQNENEADQGRNELLAIYLAGSLIRNDSTAYAAFFKDLLKNLRDQSSEMIQALQQNNNLLKQEPSAYQNALNLAARLDLSVEQRSGYIGQAIVIPFAVTGKNQINPDSANVTFALVLLKQIGATTEQVQTMARLGFMVTKASANSQAVAEYSTRVQAYFPSVKL